MAPARSTKTASAVADATPPRPKRRQVTVDDYTGATATAAVEAARATGLRPAPERVDVADADSYGLVVAHDPKAGATTARGTILTLYVGAPAAQPDADFDDVVDDPEAPATGSAAAQTVDAPLAGGGGSEEELGLSDPAVAEVLASAELVIESPIAPPLAGAGGPQEVADRSNVGRPPQRRFRRRALAAAALVALILLAAIVTARTTPPRPPSREAPAARAHLRQRPSRDRHRGNKPNRGRPVPRRRRLIAPVVAPRASSSSAARAAATAWRPRPPQLRPPLSLPPDHDEFF
ncbi:MAG: PASTA domain-containing protein [Thermoleophilaceae bacterium]